MPVLISADEYANLPENPEECFLALEEICRRRLDDLRGSVRFEQNAYPLMQQYMHVVRGAAIECGLDDLPIEYDDEGHARFSEFQNTVDTLITRLRLRGRRRFDPYSVELKPATRARVEFHISALRTFVSEADLPDRRKRALLSNLDDLSQEIAGSRRVSFAKVMAILAPLMGATIPLAANMTTMAADGPAAVANIMRLLGIAKAAENNHLEKQKELQKLLPAPEKAPPKPSSGYEWGQKVGSDLDDDIPF